MLNKIVLIAGIIEQEISIKDLSALMSFVIGYKGHIMFEESKPDGTMRKVTDVKKLYSFDRKHSAKIQEGVKKFYN